MLNSVSTDRQEHILQNSIAEAAPPSTPAFMSRFANDLLVHRLVFVLAELHVQLTEPGEF